MTPRFDWQFSVRGHCAHLWNDLHIKKEWRIRCVSRGFRQTPTPGLPERTLLSFSSRYEGLPNVVLEALACRTPVIATPAPGGTREILDDIAECVVAREVGSQALADAIGEWLEGSRDCVPETAVAPYRLSVIMARYEQLLDTP